jgi:hypothetical protein
MTTAAAPQFVKVPRVITVDAVVGASVVGFPSVLTIPQDADFEWWFLAAFRTSGQAKVLITESGTQRQFVYSGSPQQTTAFNGVFIDNLGGLVSNNSAFPIAVPYVMPASRVYQHLFTDLSGAQNTIQLVYHGFALLPIGPS